MILVSCRVVPVKKRPLSGPFGRNKFGKRSGRKRPRIRTPPNNVRETTEAPENKRNVRDEIEIVRVVTKKKPPDVFIERHDCDRLHEVYNSRVERFFATVRGGRCVRTIKTRPTMGPPGVEVDYRLKQTGRQCAGVFGNSRT